MACSKVVESETVKSGVVARSLGMGFALGGLAMTLVNFSPVALAPRLNEELWRLLRRTYP